jgi:hypothetical protein
MPCTARPAGSTSGCQRRWGANLGGHRPSGGWPVRPELCRTLAAVLEVSETNLCRVWQQSNDATSLRPADEIFDLVRSAHVLSILLRGRYHDLVAQEMGMQVLHHPVRAPVLPDLAEVGAAPVLYEVTNTERVMAHLLWASGFAERGHSGLIRLWAENVRLVRMAVLAETVDLPQRASADRAVDTAVDAARRAGVRTHSKLFEHSIDLAVAMGLGVLSSFVVNGWSDMAITAGAYAVRRRNASGNAPPDRCSKAAEG